jgi:K+-transporting ATPase KdpF subunit
MAIGSIFHLEQNAADAVTPELRRAVLMEFLARQSLAPNTSRSKDQHKWTSSSSGSRFCSSVFPSPTSKLATLFKQKDRTMLVDYILGGGVTLFLLVYLTYALVRPERF